MAYKLVQTIGMIFTINRSEQTSRGDRREKQYDKDSEKMKYRKEKARKKKEETNGKEKKACRKREKKDKEKETGG